MKETVIKSTDFVEINKVVNVHGIKPFKMPYKIVVDFSKIPEDCHELALSMMINNI